MLIDEEFHIDKDVPVIAMGVNVDVKKNEKAFGFMKKHFDLNMVPTNYPSTLENSYIDSTFTRYISPKLLNYSVSVALHVDASDLAIGGALHRLVDSELEPLALSYRKLTPAESSYSAYDRELLAAYSTLPLHAGFKTVHCFHRS
ncbi:hypothetical protein AVEN_139837-1 [Araneus ventricosus]|uniref:Reverse transcriptase/retrotransposon-derived protein RNase H-like domain-containing protein n=1 Tax=Araneus ventricosus TaxID=182803 RepID=A0A4Y2G0W5_ARAVE|nr:hypothetical protein AVEN_139837-1 [Araneus ventricosus]